MRILLVEDDSATAKSIELMLKAEGSVVDTTDLGEDGLEIGKLYDYDIIILDLMLPGRSGLDILRDLRARGEFENLPVLMLTARGQSRDRDMAERAGVSRFMTKPFSNVEVLTAVRDLVALAGRA